MEALLLFGLFALLYKLLFPYAKLGMLFQKKRWLYLLLCAGVLTLADRLLRQYTEGYAAIRAAAGIVLGFLTSCCSGTVCSEDMPPLQERRSGSHFPVPHETKYRSTLSMKRPDPIAKRSFFFEGIRELHGVKGRMRFRIVYCIATIDKRRNRR